LEPSFSWRNETLKQKWQKLGKSPNRQVGPTGKEAAEKAARLGQQRGAERGPLQEKKSIGSIGRVSGHKEPGRQVIRKVG